MDRRDRVLVLNADYTPYRIVDLERAMGLLFANKAKLIMDYADKVLRSAHQVWQWPAVLVLVNYVREKTRVKFSPKNVLRRDEYTCQYCGVRPSHTHGKPDRSLITMDHVVPRAQARNGEVVLPWNKKRVGVTSWENTVAACKRCNSLKADRTPEQAGMRLAHYPIKPGTWDNLRIALAGGADIPREWMDYIPDTLVTSG